eukprot:TRINITY_DN8289_c0_g1_i1.p1 TRINITY_DN8289_c0_g1~~TRINITY_DN8289_c0_g1_i1.p1  ORF type:complete len:451 (-),score=105.22 TRINITY_DN8289_c0_g1_i1:94-1386(-)
MCIRDRVSTQSTWGGAAEMQVEKSDIFTIKILRLNKPFVVPYDTLRLENNFSLGGEYPNGGNTSLGGSQYLQLNTDLTNVFVGETLKLLLSITNSSSFAMEYATVSVTNTFERRTNNSDGTISKRSETVTVRKSRHPNMRPGIPVIISVEVKVTEPDRMGLNFEIAYKIEAPTSPQTAATVVERVFSRKIEFLTRAPFEVFYRSWNLKDQLTALELRLDNNSKLPLVLHSIGYEPSPAYQRADQQPILANAPILLRGKDESPETKKDSYCVLLMLTPTRASAQRVGFGTISLRWCTPFNEMCTYSLPLDKLQPYSPTLLMKLSDGMKTTLLHEQLVPLCFDIVNRSNAGVKLTLKLSPIDMVAIRICSISTYELLMLPEETKTIKLDVFPFSIGLQKLRGLKLMRDNGEVMWELNQDFCVVPSTEDISRE